MNTDNKVGINDRQVIVNYPTWEQAVDRMKHIHDVISKDLKTMGNEQIIDGVSILEHNHKYQVIFNLKPTV